MAYATVDEVRAITGLSSSDLSDTVISGMISYATAQLNADVQVKWSNERAGYIGIDKENHIDGSNTTFYTQYYYIGDADNNGIISGADVYAYKIDNSGARSRIIVSSVADSYVGEIILVSAPASSDALYFTYYTSPVDMSEPHPLIKLACIQLSSALCFTRIDATKVQSFRVGKIAVMKQSQAFDIFKAQYYNTLNSIRSEMFKTAVGTKEI